MFVVFYTEQMFWNVCSLWETFSTCSIHRSITPIRQSVYGHLFAWIVILSPFLWCDMRICALLVKQQQIYIHRVLGITFQMHRDNSVIFSLYAYTYIFVFSYFIFAFFLYHLLDMNESADIWFSNWRKQIKLNFWCDFKWTVFIYFSSGCWENIQLLWSLRNLFDFQKRSRMVQRGYSAMSKQSAVFRSKKMIYRHRLYGPNMLISKLNGWICTYHNLRPLGEIVLQRTWTICRVPVLIRQWQLLIVLIYDDRMRL